MPILILQAVVLAQFLHHLGDRAAGIASATPARAEEHLPLWRTGADFDTECLDQENEQQFGVIRAQQAPWQSPKPAR
ncbi:MULTISPECIES: hypothetical protein [unclassified Duganella]|uniref:hypothetical protein n=1 Tax=unclassified Duganella TaxID=2636909 RepID=UPI000B7E6F89|nr:MULTISPECIES: hypothetical protein [unclassified Duganella]